MMHESYSAEKSTAERIATIETMVIELHRRLLGNGQPGEIERMRAEQKHTNERFGKRLAAVERFCWMLLGGSPIAAFLGMWAFKKLAQ